MAGTAVRLAFAVCATVLAASAAAELNNAFALVATGVVCGAAITLWGFAHVRWREL
jgi:hypothetical protein